MTPPEQADNLEEQIKQLRSRGLDPVGAAVMQYADEGVYLSGDYLRTEERLLSAVSSEDSGSTPTWTQIWLRMGIRLAQQRIREIQFTRTPEGRMEIISKQQETGHLSDEHWFEMLAAWDRVADPHGLALLEQGIEIEREQLLGNTGDNDRIRNADTVKAGQRLIIDYYRGLVEPQGN